MHEVEGTAKVSQAGPGVDIVLPVIQNSVVFKREVVPLSTRNFEEEACRGQVCPLDIGN